MITRTFTLQQQRNRNDVVFFIKSTIFLLFSVYIAMVSSNIASKLTPTSMGPLEDIGFDLIPAIDCLYLSDILTIILAGSVVFKLVILRAGIRPLRKLSYIFERLSVGYLMRSSMVFMTSLPDPRPSCEPVTGSIWFTFRAHRCGDCLFSGHTFIFVTFGLYWWRVGTMFGAAMAACSVMGIYLVIANRAHYTVDVLIAVYMAFFVDFYVKSRRERSG